MEIMEVFKVCVGDEQVGSAHTSKEPAIRAAKVIGDTARVIHCTFNGEYNQVQDVWPKLGVRANHWTNIPAWTVDNVVE